MKTQFRPRLSQDGLFLLSSLAKKLGVSKASVIELTIRQKAAESGIEVSASSAPQPEAPAADLYGWHPWMRQIEAHVKPLESVRVEDVLLGAFGKAPGDGRSEEQERVDRRVVCSCLIKLGWINRNQAGIWSPAPVEAKPEAPCAVPE